MPRNTAVVVGVARGGSDAAVRFAAGEAARAGRPLELVHVAPALDGWGRQLGKDSLHLAVRRARSVGGDALELHTSTRFGEVVSELVGISCAAELLVLERRPPVVLRQRLASVTEDVADAVDVPLVSVPTDWTPGHQAVLTVGLDVATPNQRALRPAIRLARLR